MTKAQKAEQAEARERLREMVSPGDTLYTILKHCSRSGMMRVVQVVKLVDGEPWYLGYNTALACGMTYNRNHEGVTVGGCGMDAGFSVISNLGYALYPDGFTCTGDDKRGRNRCPSNDHSNGDRSYEKHQHSSGGYAFHHRWL